MSTVNQRTLARSLQFSGLGLHGGAGATVIFKPAPENSGIVFKLGDVIIPAKHEYVVETKRGTTIGRDGRSVRTIEHALSALRGMGVDNAIIEVDGEEMPALDGSAWPYAEAIEKGGIVELPGSARLSWKLQPGEPFVFTTGLSSYKILPCDQWTLSASISFPNTPIGVQDLGFTANGSYAQEISRARTFCLESDVEKLRASGLAQGGSLANTIVVGTDRIQCEEPLRYKDEFVRHKILDLMGDLSLLGPGDYYFHVIAFAPSHTANWKLTQELSKRLQLC